MIDQEVDPIPAYFPCLISITFPILSEPVQFPVPLNKLANTHKAIGISSNTNKAGDRTDVTHEQGSRILQVCTILSCISTHTRAASTADRKFLFGVKEG
jgi:hypothetical protein